jgi:hypothetical protein
MTTLPPHNNSTFAGTTTTLPAWEDVAVPQIPVEIGGKIYLVPPMSIGSSLELGKAFAGDEEAQAKFDDPETFYRAVLGPLFDEFIADGVPAAAVDRVHLTAIQDWAHGRIAAESFWQLGPDPEIHREYVDATRRMWEAAQAAKDADPRIDVEAT